MTETTLQNCSNREFEGIVLGDRRLVERLELMVTRASERPAGHISKVFPSSAERQGAYGLLNHPEVSAEQLTEGLAHATVLRCADVPYAFVPLDGSSLTLRDRLAAKDFGAIGTFTAGALGIKVMSAIAVSPGGVPLGICHQDFWVRKARVAVAREKRTVEEKETRFWVQAIEAVTRRFAEAASVVRPWFQLDQEGDSWPVLRACEQQNSWLTVRARHDRRLITCSGQQARLRGHLRSLPVAGRFELTIPAGPGRRARQAQMTVRHDQVVLDLRDKASRTRYALPAWAVMATEQGTTPPGEPPVTWWLVTNVPVLELNTALTVIRGYAQRWRIEEFHRTWKAGACHIEDTQLRSRPAVQKWAVILAAAAMRILRLTYLGRHQPGSPAAMELGPLEIVAIQLLLNHQPKTSKQPFTMAQAVQCLARIGGHDGYPRSRPPGPTVLARGLNRVQELATGLAMLLKRWEDLHSRTYDQR